MSNNPLKDKYEKMFGIDSDDAHSGIESIIGGILLTSSTTMLGYGVGGEIGDEIATGIGTGIGFILGVVVSIKGVYNSNL